MFKSIFIFSLILTSTLITISSSFALTLKKRSLPKDVLLHKDATNALIRQCSLTAQKVIYKTPFAGFESKGVITQIFNSKAAGLSPMEIEKLGTAATKSKEKEFFKWDPTQRDYFVRQKNLISSFYSAGFKNILNKSVAARSLINLLDSNCSGDTYKLQIIGDFEFYLDTGSRVFTDILKVYLSPKNIVEQRIIGSYEVPGSFKSKIKALSYDNGKFSFVIKVDEGQTKYESEFKGEFYQENGVEKIKGNAFILPHKKLLGTFTGIRI